MGVRVTLDESNKWTFYICYLPMSMGFHLLRLQVVIVGVVVKITKMKYFSRQQFVIYYILAKIVTLEKLAMPLMLERCKLLE